MRGIPYELPKEIYLTAEEHYYDTETGRRVAVKKVKFKNRLREMAVIYDIRDERVDLITVHPLKNSQKANRIKSRRWQKL